MSEYTYTVVLQPEDDGTFSVFVPALPGCYSQGQNQPEALLNAQEAIQCYIEGLIKDNVPIPKEKQPVIQTLKIVA